MTISPFSRAFLLMFSGPLIWAAHFLAVYVFAALACARNFAHVEWLGVGVTNWTVGMLTLAAVGAIAAILLLLRNRRQDDASARFVRWTTFSLGLLSILSIVWDALPTYLVPACG